MRKQGLFMVLVSVMIVTIGFGGLTTSCKLCQKRSYKKDTVCFTMNEKRYLFNDLTLSEGDKQIIVKNGVVVKSDFKNKKTKQLIQKINLYGDSIDIKIQMALDKVGNSMGAFVNKLAGGGVLNQMTSSDSVNLSKNLKGSVKVTFKPKSTVAKSKNCCSKKSSQLEIVEKTEKSTDLTKQLELVDGCLSNMCGMFISPLISKLRPIIAMQLSEQPVRLKLENGEIKDFEK